MEGHICELTAELLKRGVGVTLAVCPAFGMASGRRCALSERGAKFEQVRMTAKTDMRALTGSFSLRRLCNSRRFDAIVCHGVGLSHIAASIGNHEVRLVWHDHLSGGEIVTNAEEFVPPQLKRYSWLFRRFLDGTSAVITGSERGRRHLRAVQSVTSDIHVIPPLGWLPTAERDVDSGPSRPVTCGLFGNLSPQKNIEPLLRLWAHPDLNTVRLVVFGNDHEQRYELLARRLGLTSVDFRGPYTEQALAGHAKEIDFAIIASAAEGYPLVAIELMACGVPLVATKVGACPELDPSGRHVILVDHGADSVRSGILQMVQRINSGAVDRSIIQQRAHEIYDRGAVVERHLRAIGALA